MSTSRIRLIRSFQIPGERRRAIVFIVNAIVLQFSLLFIIWDSVAIAAPGDIRASNRFNPSVLLIQDGTSTKTPTSTQGVGNPMVTHTPTITRTSQAISPSQTPTQTGYNPYPAPTLFPGQSDLPPGSQSVAETVNPTFVSSGTITGTVAATTTLIPFPTIELDFPSAAGMSVPTPPADINTFPGISWFTPTRLLLILFVTFMWIFLGGWYYFSLRKMK